MPKFSTEMLNEYTKTVKLRMRNGMLRMTQWVQDAAPAYQRQYNKIKTKIAEIKLPKFPIERIDNFANRQIDTILHISAKGKSGCKRMYSTLKEKSTSLKGHTINILAKSTSFFADYIALKCERCSKWLTQQALPSIKENAINLKEHTIKISKKPAAFMAKKASQYSQEWIETAQAKTYKIEQMVLAEAPNTAKVDKLNDSMNDAIKQIKQGWNSLKGNFLPYLNKGWNLIIEYTKLFFLNLVVQKRNFIEFMKVLWKYYPNISFMRVDLALLRSYIFNSPYKISKKFLIEREENNIYAYGETPLTTLDKISRYARLTDRDVVMELGCGRGRTCFWLRSFIGCKVIGVDYIGKFIEKANKVKADYKVDGVNFVCEDMFSTGISGVTVVYFYGTCMDDESIERLTKKFEQLPSGAKVITVSYPLTGYTHRHFLELMNVFPAQFTWGTADVYIHYRK